VKKIACCSVKDLCANRHAHNQVSASMTGTIRAFAMRTSLGDVLRVITQVQQRVQRQLDIADLTGRVPHRNCPQHQPWEVDRQVVVRRGVRAIEITQLALEAPVDDLVLL